MKVDWISHSKDYIYSKISKTACSHDLDLVQPELDPFDPPTPKTLP